MRYPAGPACCWPAIRRPTVAVTALGTVLFVSAGNPVRTCLLGALALLTGQLSIGWSNDLIDQRRDRQAGRRRQAAGRRDADRRPAPRRPALLAGLLTVPASLALGLAGRAAAPGRGGRRLVLQPRPEVPAGLATALPVRLRRAARGGHPGTAARRDWPPAWIMLAAGADRGGRALRQRAAGPGRRPGRRGARAAAAARAGPGRGAGRRCSPCWPPGWCCRRPAGRWRWRCCC